MTNVFLLQERSFTAQVRKYYTLSNEEEGKRGKYIYRQQSDYCHNCP